MWAALFTLILFFRQRDGLPAKTSMLDFSAILENALAMWPDTNIVGGSVHINLIVRQREGLPAKASMLDFSAILEDALAMRPDTNIVGGSVFTLILLF